jgi:hypothetical protein
MINHLEIDLGKLDCHILFNITVQFWAFEAENVH